MLSSNLKLALMIAVFLIPATVAFGQGTESTIDDFVGIWTSKLKEKDKFYNEMTISKIENGVEIVDMIVMDGSPPIDRRNVFHFDGRIDVNFGADGNPRSSTSVLKKNVIEITFLYIDKKTGKQKNLNKWKYRLSKGKLFVMVESIEDDRTGLPRPWEIEMIRKSG